MAKVTSGTNDGACVGMILERRKTREHITFDQWLGFLDQVYLTLRFKSRITKQTGAECWRDYYDDGYTPFEAMLADFSYSYA